MYLKRWKRERRGKNRLNLRFLFLIVQVSHISYREILSKSHVIMYFLFSYLIQSRRNYVQHIRLFLVYFVLFYFI